MAQDCGIEADYGIVTYLDKLREQNVHGNLKCYGDIAAHPYPHHPV